MGRLTFSFYKIRFNLLNIIYTMVDCILFIISRNDIIIKCISSFGYLLIFMIITVSTIFIINLKN